MQIFKLNSLVNINEKISAQEQRLIKEKILVLDTQDHLDHIAAFIAWKNVGGNIFILNPTLPKAYQDNLLLQISNTELENNIVFHTSGSTGAPKLVIHSNQQMNQAMIMGEKAIGWNRNTRWLNLIPACTSGFWHIVLPNLFDKDAAIHLSTMQTLEKDVGYDVNECILVPSLIDVLRSRKVSLDLSKFNAIASGASQIQRRHAEYVFLNGAREFNHCYGTTEICAPVLNRRTIDIDDSPEYVQLTANNDNEYRIKNNELQVRGLSICENKESFNQDQGWYQTGDLWEQKDNLIKFVGRTNDIVKINGCQCNLLEVESVFENEFGLGECIAVPKNTRGVEWLELQYTGNGLVDNIKVQAKRLLPKQSIPLKFIKVESVARNSLGKKIRSTSHS